MDLTHPAVDALREVDNARAALEQQRAALHQELRETARPRHGATDGTSGAGHTVPVPPPPPATAGARPGEATVDTKPAGRGVPALLAFAGVCLLGAAATVFAAVVWTVLSPAAQAVMLVVATVAAIAIALFLDRRGLHTTAGAVGVVAMLFAAADVVGLDRSALIPLGEATTPAAAGIAAGLGFVLARVSLRWVSTAGALAAALAATSGAGVTIDAVVSHSWSHPLIAAAFGVVLAATTRVWPSRPGRTITWLAAGLLVATGAIVGAVSLGDTSASVVLALVSAIVPVALMAAAGTRTPWSLAPAALLAILLPVTLAGRYTDEGWLLAAVGAWTAAVLAWSVVVARPPHRAPLLAGSVPVIAVTTVIVILAAGQALLRLVFVATRTASVTTTPLSDLDAAPWLTTDPWTAAVAVAAGVAAIAWPPARRLVSTVVAGVLATASASMPILAAGVVLAAASLVGLAAVEHARRRETEPHVDTAVVVLLGLAGAGWLSSIPVGLAIAAGLAAITSWRIGVHVAGTRRAIAALSAVAASAVAAFGITEALQTPNEISLAAGLLAGLAIATIAQRTSLDDGARATPWSAAIVTIAAVLATDTDGARGAMLLLAAAGWTVMAITGRRALRWPAALLAAAGATTLQSLAGVDQLEAYTAVWATALACAGLWRLIEVPTTPTLPMLWPAATIGLLPSMVVLAADPRVLARAVILAAAGVALALVGVQLRWKAPLLAGVAAASWVGMTQVWRVVTAMPGWIAFGLLGTALVVLAATYEHHQRQIRRFRGWLTDLR